MDHSTDELVVALDADDTLWANEDNFQQAESEFVDLLNPYCADRSRQEVSARLFEIQRDHLDIYGVGVKCFTLSMVEAATELSDGAIGTADINHLLDIGKNLLRLPVHLLPGVEEAVAALAENYRLLLVTKGELTHQQAKIDQSGLAHHFESTHVLARKSASEYQTLLDAKTIDPANFVMVGNSLKSDVLPVIELGGMGIHIPYHLLWVAEETTAPDALDVPTLTELAEVLPYLKALQGPGERTTS